MTNVVIPPFRACPAYLSPEKEGAVHFSFPFSRPSRLPRASRASASPPPLREDSSELWTIYLYRSPMSGLRSHRIFFSRSETKSHRPALSVCEISGCPGFLPGGSTPIPQCPSGRILACPERLGCAFPLFEGRPNQGRVCVKSKSLHQQFGEVCRSIPQGFRRQIPSRSAHSSCRQRVHRFQL